MNSVTIRLPLWTRCGSGLRATGARTVAQVAEVDEVDEVDERIRAH
jgi:hypothetical protein